MNRGILELTKEEVTELTKYLSLEKLVIARESNNEISNILINEDELETILDEIGPINDNHTLVSIKEKIYQLLPRIRGIRE